MAQSMMSLMQPPDDELAVPVPISPMVLLRNDDVMVALSAIEAFSNGFVVRLVALTRRAEDHGRPPHFAMSGRGGPGSMQLGVLYADGRRGDTTLGPDPNAALRSPDRISIMPRGGQGGPRRLDQSFWIHPLPPSGPLTFVAQWREVGLNEQRREIDSEPILTAAAGITPIWPRDTPPVEQQSPDEIEGALLSALTHQLAGIDSVRIRGVLFDGHHPDTNLLIAYDTLLPQRVAGELRVALWVEGDTDLAHRSPLEVGAAIVARLRTQTNNV
jgi:hypothetical protein